MLAMRLAGWVIGIAIVAPAIGSAQTGPVRPFEVPRDRADWERRRHELLQQVGVDPARDRTEPPANARFSGDGSGASDGRERLTIEEEFRREPAIVGIYTRPTPAGSTQRVPLVVLLLDPTAPDETTGWDGRPPAQVLTQAGYAVLSFDHQYFAQPIGFGGANAPLARALDATLERPEIDAARVAVLGIGPTGMTALRLMATDPRVACGVVAIESRDAGLSGLISSKGISATITTNYQELAALCAPRPIHLMIGEPLPLPPGDASIGRRIEHAAKGTYKAAGKPGNLYFTLFGEFAGHNSINTRLQWLAGLEWLDKHFRPQGPTPLGHAPEPEPTLDPTSPAVLNLTEHGIAGWVSEMSGRDSTWTWQDGVVRCQPRAFEYGWLRAPVAVSDYLLQVEWRVPRHGNAGIFMRAQPVTWFLPPTEENKLRISSLGLTWPSRTGLELQTQDDPGDANRYSTGSLYRHAAPAANPTHSPDRWNRSTVRARGPRIEVWNNGEQVLDADLNRSADTLPDPPLRGYIGLQNHGNSAEYRNVRLQRLAPESLQGAMNTSSAASPAGRASR